MCAVGKCHGCAHACNLFRDQHAGEEIRGGSAVWLRDRDTQHTEVSHPWPEFARESVLAIDFICQGRYLASGKLANRIPCQSLGIAEFNVHCRRPCTEVTVEKAVVGIV